jgi:hypothetical protein
MREKTPTLKRSGNNKNKTASAVFLRLELAKWQLT